MDSETNYNRLFNVRKKTTQALTSKYLNCLFKVNPWVKPDYLMVAYKPIIVLCGFNTNLLVCKHYYNNA